MEVLETLILIVAWVFVATWLYGVRIKPVMPTTALLALLKLLAVVYVSVTDASAFHLLWVLPLTFLSARPLAKLMWLPFMGFILIFPGRVFIEILRLGMSAERKQQMREEFRANTTALLHDLMNQREDK